MFKEKKFLIPFILLITSMIVFITIAIIVYIKGGVTALDNNVRDFFYDIRGTKGGFSYWFFNIITVFGSWTGVIITFVLLMLYTKADRRFTVFLFGIMLATLIANIVKVTYLRDRPFEEFRWAEESSGSFVSGHSTTSSFLTGLWLYMFISCNFNKKIKITGYVLWPLYLILILISRLVLGVHYFTDIIGGASLGILVASLCCLILYVFEKNEIMTTPLWYLLKKDKKNEKDSNAN